MINLLDDNISPINPKSELFPATKLFESKIFVSPAANVVPAGIVNDFEMKNIHLDYNHHLMYFEKTKISNFKKINRLRFTNIKGVLHSCMKNYFTIISHFSE